MKIFHSLSKAVKSDLYNENTFYGEFLKDLESARKTILIESPYIVSDRMDVLTPVFQRILIKGVQIEIVTRDPIEHESELFRHQATNEILRTKELGVNITLLKGYLHRKLAIIDNKILWEGSLNILSQNKSKEVMRRTESYEQAQQMLDFIK